MAVFLTVLKVIGIILLCIIGFLLLIILLALFVPIRYKLKGNKGIENSDIKASVCVSWLLHLISFKAEFVDSKLAYSLKLLGIKIKKSESGDIKSDAEVKSDKADKAPSSSKMSQPDTEKAKHEKEPTVKELADNDGNLYKIECSDDVTESCDTKDEHFEEESNNLDTVFEDDTASTQKDGKNALSKILDKIKALFDKVSKKIISIIEKIRDSYNHAEETAKKISKEYDFYTRFIEDERNKDAIKLCIKELKHVIRIVLPRRIKGRVHFGFDDPATTGQILVFLSILYGLVNYRLVVEPDFENSILEGNIEIKGKITIFVILYAAARVYFNKNVKRLIRIYKKHKAKITQS